MTIGLDIAGRSIQSLRRDAGRLIGRRIPAEYIALPPTANERRLLERARVPYAVCDGSLIVYGSHAAELAPLVHVPRLPVLPQGKLPPNDPLSRQLAASMLDALLPEATAADAVCAVVPPDSADADDPTDTPEWEFFSRLIRMRGYRPVAIDRPSALILARLGHTGFSGLALTFEDFRCAAAITRCGRVLAEAAVPRGLAWIDEQLARSSGRVIWDMDGNSYVDTDAVAQWKQAVNPSLLAPETSEERFLAARYHELVRDLLARLADGCLQAPDVATFRGPLSLVCSGEATMARGFAGLLAEDLNQAGLPISFGDIRIADDPAFTVARGCLIRAELELGTPDQQNAA